MKKLSFFALAAVGLLFGACSSDKDVAEDALQVVEEEDGNQFIALNINLPSTSSSFTRSSETDDNNYGDSNFELNDGLESEYTVKDATLIVFRGATEDAATFVAAYDINPEPWTTSADKQVTDYSTKIVQKVGTTVQVNDLALVVLNRNSLLQFKTDGTLQAYVGGAWTNITTATTFADFQTQLATSASAGKTAASAMTTNGFFMANAPLTDVAGSQATEPTGATTRTLVTIKNVYETEAEARTGSCAEIYVERGMAKVTVNTLAAGAKLDTKYGVGVSGVTPADLAITLNGWTLDQTNASSYFVRSVAGHSDFIKLKNADAPKYRYIGQSDITEGIVAGDTYKYRTYFAKDPNYEEATPPTTFGNALSGLTVLTDVPAALSTGFGENNPLYCYENTFDVAHQSINNTTLVRLKVTASTGAPEDLYVINGNKSSIYKEADVKTLIANKCVELINASGVVTSSPIVSSDITVTLSARDADGFKNINSVDAAAADLKISSGTRPTNAELLTAVKALYKDNTVGSKNGSILCYEGGVSYYTIRVKHFGDQLTPWKKAGSLIAPVPSLANGSYPNWNSTTPADKAACDANYLGRYGMLRNNWYDISVNSIKYLGEAVPVDYSNDPTPDDEIDGYIAVKINILSWAKRKQSWDL